VALVNFGSTVAPTTSFWDCGEFIAASYTMGVPHPPGAPLYLLVGRLFSLLPLADNIGLRINLLSTLVSTFTVMLLYLCIVHLARIWRGRENTVAEKITVYGGAAVGALAFAFSHSFWWNAVEAEVYAVSMFFTAFVFYLALRWRDSADAPSGNRILLFIFYLVGLSIGVHLLNILALLAVAYIVAFRRIEINLRSFILTGLIGSIIIFAIYPGIIQGLPLLIKKFSVWSVAILLIALVWMAVSFIKRDKRLPALAVLSALLVMLGYSTFLIIKIRSGLDPFLDENDPETWSRLLSYLNREQYGSESLILTMFKRKAPLWSYQINKMYIRYLGWQYFEVSRFFALPFLLGVIGAVHHFYRDSKGAFTVLVLFLMTGLAVVFYLNQDDPQPRERDYAYVGSFFAFAIWIGLGVLSLVEMTVGALKKLKPALPAGAVTALCLMVVPINMWVKNHHNHSRSGNYIAWDYSYNLLETCEPNAILYTNGDNDTFPLWYLQEVEGVRQDVRVVNLSLLNTGWFIKQLRDKEPRVPMLSRITDQYIDHNVESRDISGLLDRRWQETRKVKIKGPFMGNPDLVWDVPATLSYPVGPGGRAEHFLRVQDFMILNTIVASAWKRPIYFAVTVADNNLVGLRNITDQTKNYLTMEGLAFRVTPQPSPLIDPERLAENMLHRYRYRNIDNPDIYYNENILKLLGNYRQGLIQLAYHYTAQAGDTVAVGAIGPDAWPADDVPPLDERVAKFEELTSGQKALTALDFMEDNVPEELVPIKFDIIALQIGKLYAQLGRPEEMRRRLDRLSGKGELTTRSAYEYGTYYLTDAGAPDRARELYQISLEKNGSFDNYRRIAITWLQFSGDTSYTSELFRQYLVRDNSRQARLRIAGQALALGLGGLTFSIYEQMLNENPRDGEAVRGMIEYYQYSGNLDRALALADDWLSLHPDDQGMIKRREEMLKVISEISS